MAATLASESYPAEYAPRSDVADVMDRLSAATGGRGEIQAGQAFDGDGLVQGVRSVRLTLPLLLLAALLWPLKTVDQDLPTAETWMSNAWVRWSPR